MDEDEREFWNLMKEPTPSEARLNKVIKRMQQHDELSMSSGGGLSQTNDETDNSQASPRQQQQLQPVSSSSSMGAKPAATSTPRPSRQEDIDLTVTSLGTIPISTGK